MVFFVFFRKSLQVLRKENLGRLMVVTFFILVIGTVGMALFEKGRNESLDSIGDAIWWSFVTITTVGYGEKQVSSGISEAFLPSRNREGLTRPTRQQDIVVGNALRRKLRYVS